MLYSRKKAVREIPPWRVCGGWYKFLLGGANGQSAHLPAIIEMIVGINEAIREKKMSGFKQTRAAILVAAMMTAGGGASQAATLTAQERANEQLVVDFYAALNATDVAATGKQHVRSIAERFISPDYIQHSDTYKGPGSARERFISGMEHMPSGPRPGFQAPPKTIALMADGDMVTIVTSRELPDGAGGTRPVFIFNLFRIKDGRLAEHWDALPAALTGAGPTKR
jgi:predicted SnoaL-like aldol condensation-catalyzing enzyme